MSPFLKKLYVFGINSSYEYSLNSDALKASTKILKTSFLLFFLLECNAKGLPIKISFLELIDILSPLLNLK